MTDRSRTPLVIAHRGNSSVAPQNTLAAFEAAWRAGADFIELDVQFTGDGQAVVIHDDTVDVTTDGTGRIDATELAAIRALDAGSWFSPSFVRQRVPTMVELVDLLCHRPGIDLLIEIKGVRTTEQLRLVTGPLADAGLVNRVVVQSFHPSTVAALAQVEPALRRGLLIAEDMDIGTLLDRCRELGVMTCNPSGLLLSGRPQMVNVLHEAGLLAMVWTLNEPEHWWAAVAAKVDGIITDRPDRLAGWLVGHPSRAGSAHWPRVHPAD